MELAAQQKATTEELSAIEQQAQADVQSLGASETADGVDADVDQQGLLTQPRNIAATQNSIFSTSNSGFVDQGVTQKSARLNANRPMDTTKSSLYADNSVEAVIAADSATMPSYESLAERMAVPTPKSDEAAAAQTVAMGDIEIPVLDTTATPAADALQQSDEAAANQVASADLAALQVQLATSSLPATTKRVEKKPLTLAELFRKSDPNGGDTRTLGRKTVTRSIPNMRTAALADDTLPGVEANAMFPITAASSDDEHDEEEGEGLMQLASLPSMTRIAPNGLYVQTDKVEVSCLRPELVSIIHTVQNHYKRPAIITSGFRDPRRNRRAGGVRHSLHTMCAAVDIQVQGVSKWQLADFLRSLPGRGGIGTYCHTESVHVDIGGERDWNWRCRRKKRMRG
jgi:uncharacterized protein YcbK (DUF882 family)